MGILHSFSEYFPHCQALDLPIPHSIQRVYLLRQGTLLVQVQLQSQYIQTYLKTKTTPIWTCLFTLTIYHGFIYDDKTYRYRVGNHLEKALLCWNKCQTMLCHWKAEHFNAYIEEHSACNGVIMAVRILAVSAACISLTQRVFSFIIHLSFYWQRSDFQYLWNKHYYKMKQFKPHARYPRDEQFQHGTSMPHHGASVECIPSPEKPIHSSLLQNRKLQNRNTASILTSCSQNHLCRLWSVLQPPTAWAPTSQLPDALDISVVTMTQIYLFHL